MDEPTLFSPEPARPSWTAQQLAGLLAVPGVGPVTALRIARQWPNPDTYDPSDGLHDLGGVVLPDHLPEPLGSHAEIQMVGYFDDAYPAALYDLADPPPVLWVRGPLPADRPLLAVVGTRHPTKVGRHTSRVAAEVAIEAGMGIVSGLALGCDTIAHTTAVDLHGYTAAVLGGGLLTPSPRSNRDLAGRILDEGGALITEVLPDDVVNPRQLVRRNRLQAGLAVAVVVAETGIPGGTLHTARFALEQGRQLVVPRPSDVVKGPRGNLELTDPEGPQLPIEELLGASKSLAERLSTKRPLADRVATTDDQLRQHIREIAGVGRRTR